MARNKPLYMALDNSQHKPLQEQHPKLSLGFNLSFPVMSPKRLPPAAQSAFFKRVAVVAAIMLTVFLIVFLGQSDSAGTPKQPVSVSLQQQHSCHGIAAGGRDSSSNSSAFPGSTIIAGKSSIWRRPVIVLFGDSLTEHGTVEGGWVVKMAGAYERKADVLNRGFGGYTSSTALTVLPEVLEALAHQQAVLATVLLGTNDATLPQSTLGVHRHVPVAAYKANLMSIVQQLLAVGVRHVVVITPPPVNDAAIQGTQKIEAKIHHTYNGTIGYAAAAREVAAETSVPLFDLWRTFESQQDWREQLLAADGLHFNTEGQKLLFSGLMQVIERQLPDIRPESLPAQHPHYKLLDYNDAGRQQIAAEKSAYETSGC